MTTLDGLRTTYKIPLSKMQVKVPNADQYPLEFNVISPVRSCKLKAKSEAERAQWVELLESAVKLHLVRIFYYI